MSSSGAIHIVSPAEFDRAAAQTPGSERRAAIAPALGIASTIWGGLFAARFMKKAFEMSRDILLIQGK